MSLSQMNSLLKAPLNWIEWEYDRQKNKTKELDTYKYRLMFGLLTQRQM